MPFIVVHGQEDLEHKDAVCRGVADALTLLFSLPEHPLCIRELVAPNDENEGHLAVASPRRAAASPAASDELT
ncbi:hypothetical protein [Methylobacterium sp. D54C]